MLESFKVKHPRLHKHLITVTTFSKYLALSMLIVFPIIGFIFGFNFQKQFDKKTLNSQITLFPTIAPVQSWPIEKIKKKIKNESYYFQEGKPRNSNGRKIDSLRFMVDKGKGPSQIGGNDDFSYWITSYISENTKDFWFSKGDSSVFFTVENIIPQIETNYESIIKFAINDSTAQLIEQKILYTHHAGIYSGSRIIDYDPQQKTLLIETRGGDGCGGWGIFWKLDDLGRRTDIQKYGIGCVLDENTPDYKGYLDHKLYFISQKSDPDAPPPIPFSDDKIYYIDTLSLKKQHIPELPSNLENNF